MFIEPLAHDSQAKRGAGFAPAIHLPGGEVALGDVDHVADHVAHFPIFAARLDVPVIRVVNDVVELSALSACYIKYELFAVVIHWTGWHHSLLSLCDILR